MKIVCECYLETYSGMLWATNDGREDSSWCVVTSKAGFAHSGPVVHNEGLHVFVGHIICVRRGVENGGIRGNMARFGKIWRYLRILGHMHPYGEKKHFFPSKNRSEVDHARSGTGCSMSYLLNLI